LQRHLADLSGCKGEKMPNGGTKTHAGEGSAIAPDDKALDEKGLNGKQEREIERERDRERDRERETERRESKSERERDRMS